MNIPEDSPSVTVRVPPSLSPERLRSLRGQFPSVCVTVEPIDHIIVSSDCPSEFLTRVYQWTRENLRLNYGAPPVESTCGDGSSETADDGWFKAS